MKHKTISAMKKKKVKKVKTKKPSPNFYGLGKFNYLIFKFFALDFFYNSYLPIKYRSMRDP